MPLSFQKQEDPTGTLVFSAGYLSDRIEGSTHGSLLAEMAGVLDSTTVAWADHELKAIIADPGILQLVLDLSGIEWMSDGAFGMIWPATKAMHIRGGVLVLIPSPGIQEMIGTFGFCEFIPHVSDPSEAAMLIQAIVSGSEVEVEAGLQLRFEPRITLPLCMVVRYTGHLDRDVKDWFLTNIERHIRAGFAKIAMDFSSYTSASDTMMGCLIDITKLLAPFHGRLVLFGLNKNVYELFQLLGLAGFFTIVNTEEEALAALQLKAEAPKAPNAGDGFGYPFIPVTCPDPIRGTGGS